MDWFSTRLGSKAQVVTQNRLDGEVRHKETFCTGTDRNGPKQTEAGEVKTRKKPNGRERN